ncbi:MAG: flagellar type III secretion system protein FlhB [Pseudomonadota bacterium]
MAEGDNDDTEKELEPTQKKLEDARKQGDIPRSQDVVTAAAYGGFAIALAFTGAGAVETFGSTMQYVLRDTNEITREVFSGGGFPTIGGVLWASARGAAPWLLVPGALALLWLLGSRSLIFTPSKLAPKLSRISPVDNFKQKFGFSGIFEFGKSTAKLAIFAGLLFGMIWYELPRILAMVHSAPGPIMAELMEMLLSLLLLVLVVAALIGGIDYAFQYSQHIRKNRMSRQELKDELKQAEGDAQFRQTRRQRGQEIALNQMLQDVPTADVVVVNPTHYAVALKWSRKPGEAPVCVAKGVDEIAARMRALAAEHAVPVHRDPPTARALYGTVEIGQEILPDHYRPVAAAIRFSETMRQRAKEQSWRRK